MNHPIVGAFLAHARGEPLEIRRTVNPPPHLRDGTFRYLCDCGYSWTVRETDPVLVSGEWLGPARECVGCHAWSHGRPAAG